MRQSIRNGGWTLAALLTVAACADPVDTPLAIGGEAASLPEIVIDRVAPAPGVPSSTIERLFARSIERIEATRGVVLADKARAEIESILALAEEARTSGDLATARLYVQQAELRSVRIIIGTFGPRLADRAILVAGEGLRRVERLITERQLAGGDVGTLHHLAGAIREHRNAARQLAERDQAAEALLLAARAIDLARFALFDG